MTSYRILSETQRKRSARQRMSIVHGLLILFTLVIVARLLELQVIRGESFRALAQSQHYGRVVLPAKRGTIYSKNSKTGETNILATNTTLDLVYVDPLITDDPALVARTLVDILCTEQFHELCSRGDPDCPLELAPYYSAAFDPMEQVARMHSGVLLEPFRGELPPAPADALPPLEQVCSQFEERIRSKISQKRVTFVPLKYGATKVQMDAVSALGIPGVSVIRDTKLIYANPELVPQLRIPAFSRQLADALETDAETMRAYLRSRPLRYVRVMSKLSPDLTLKLKEVKLASLEETNRRRREIESREAALQIRDPLSSIALIPEHWRYYPDASVGSHVVGFLNNNQEAQYGIERTFDPQLKGQEGRISTVSDPQGGQILTADQTIVDARDGDSIVLTIDRFIQKRVEEIMDEAVKAYKADSGQAIVMDPMTGRIVAMVNAPTFDSNNYGTVYGKEPMYLDERKRKEVVVEIYHPDTNQFIMRGYYTDVFLPEGRSQLTEQTQQALQEIEQLYDLRDVVRYYHYLGENNRIEIFPTDRPEYWLKFSNGIGVGAYLNRTIQSIYEPGSVFKPIAMAIAIDQGEVVPEDRYHDTGIVEVDEYKIRNAFNGVFGDVNMTNCLEFSINTCMTSVSGKLGRKLYHRMIERFGFGKITGIELEDELPGEVLPWLKWSNALLATASYGQGISATPLQMVTAWAALANGGKLLKPTIVDSLLRADGSVEETKTVVVDQVIRPTSADTITAMLVTTVQRGYGKSAGIPGYIIAGKTGTSQIAGPGGKYESGTGSSVASFAGYAPAYAPRFVILVKFDRPRSRDLVFGSETAAPTFRRIAEFLFEYYGIPPQQ